ncbi:hypothetical protein ACE38W_05510 [Chitinophaga sp. Hz27]|uniref:hypothetical protein n=1 Tax=Chitinophaga sp. Hz27 TaxID=3347169 RepID=UPI0035E2ED29
MEDIAISYQQLFELNFVHTGLPTGINASEWILFDTDIVTQQLFSNYKLVMRPSAGGWRLLTVAKPGSLPWCDILNLTFRIGFTLNATAAANQQLPAHFTLPSGEEGRYLFGNIQARNNGDTFPDISTPSKIAAEPTAPQRYFGYLEMVISKGSTDFDILDNTGKIRFVKGQPPCKFQITFQK